MLPSLDISRPFEYKLKIWAHQHNGDVAQMAERFVSNEEAIGSMPIFSNIFDGSSMFLMVDPFRHRQSVIPARSIRLAGTLDSEVLRMTWYER